MNNKFVVLIPIAVIAVILSAIIIRFFVMEDKTTPPTNIVEKPKEAVKVEKGVNESKISKISSPPYFVFEGDRVSTLTMVRGQQMTVEVIDEDGDLNGVWNEILPKGVSRYALMLPSTSVTGDSIEINATDQAGHRSVLLVKSPEPGEIDGEKPIFYVNSEPQTDGASTLLKAKAPQRVEVRDNKFIEKIGRKVVNAPSYEYSSGELRKLPEGANKLIATDKAGNSTTITLIKDTTPPRISEKSPLYMKPDSSKKVKFSDSNGLFDVAGTAVIGQEYELVIYSDNLKTGENRFDAYDVAGNMSSLLVIKGGAPLAAKIISPSVSPFLVNSNNVAITVELKGGQGQRSVVINDNPTAVESGVETANVNVRLQEGLNRLSIFVKDGADNINLGLLDVIKDTKPPVIDSVDNDPVGDRIWVVKKSGDNLHKISIKDDSGIDKVTLNGNNVRLETGADKTAVVSISDKNLKNSGNEIKILDKVGNELTKSIGILGINDPKEISENIKTLIQKRNYTEAEKLVKIYSGIQPGPTADLFNGMINYGRGQYDKSIESLKKAYELRERYEPGSLNAEYNLLYLGLSYYEQWKNKGSGELSNKALLNLSRLDNSTVKSKSPEIYEKARSVINSIDIAQKK